MKSRNRPRQLLWQAYLAVIERTGRRPNTLRCSESVTLDMMQAVKALDLAVKIVPDPKLEHGMVFLEYKEPPPAPGLPT